MDSSPLSERSQAEVEQGNEDEVNDFINTQLEETHEPQADDPQLDWRTQDPTQLPVIEENEDEIVSDPDELSEVDVEPAIPQAILIAQTASQSNFRMNTADVKVHQRYARFLRDLCDKTGTKLLEAHVKHGLKCTVHRARSIELSANLSANNDLDTYAFAMVVHVWQVVYFWAQYGSHPYDSLALQFGAYFLAAHAIVQGHSPITFQRLRLAVQYWERRLNDVHICGLWRKQIWLREIAELDLHTPQNRNKMANEYLETLSKEGTAGLAWLVMQEDASGPHSTPLRKYTEGTRPKKTWALSEIIDILVSMNTELMKSLIDGSLSRKAEITTGEVSIALQRILDQKPLPPSIYQNCICDAMGISPTPLQWERVCTLMLEYVRGGNESDDLAILVDQLVRPTEEWPPHLAKRGLRRYTEWRSFIVDDGDTAPSRRHRDMVRRFVSEMLKRIEGDLQNGKGNIPLAAPVIEIGFSIKYVCRLREHRRHEQSNYLMNLAEAMFKHAYHDTFRLQQLVIYACYRPSQPWFSEIILTQLGQGYTEGAGGFSHYPAGRSNGSAYNKTSRGQWNQFEHETARSGHLDRELKKPHANNQREYVESREDPEDSGLTTEVEFLDRLSTALGSLTRCFEAEAELAKEENK